jgi:hypothetical protein
MQRPSKSVSRTDRRGNANGTRAAPPSTRCGALHRARGAEPRNPPDVGAIGCGFQPSLLALAVLLALGVLLTPSPGRSQLAPASMDVHWNKGAPNAPKLTASCSGAPVQHANIHSAGEPLHDLRGAFPVPPDWIREGFVGAVLVAFAWILILYIRRRKRGRQTDRNVGASAYVQR